MTDKGRKRRSKTMPQLVAELMAQTRLVFAATGRELSQEAVEERLVAVIDRVWDIYLQRSICASLGIAPDSVPSPASDEDDDDDE